MTGDARKTALTVLNALDRQHRTLDSVLDEAIDHNVAFSRKDRALANALVYGVLRWRGRLDRIIDRFSNVPLGRIDPSVLNILRLGLFQIIFLDRVPDSAAVNTSVEMAKAFSPPWVVKYINAVLRSAAKGHKRVSLSEENQDPVSALAAEKAFPEWLLRRWLQRFGSDETVRLCDAINTIPPITIRTNRLKISRNKLVRVLETEAENVKPTYTSPDGISFSNPRRPIFEMKSFKQGWFQVQDEAAQLVTCLLNPKPGGTFLDACAGLGGKTGHIAQLMENIGSIVAMDKNNKKLKQLETEMKRLGVSIVSSRVHDLENPPPPGETGMFDGILLDTPCSGLGVLRRNPDAKWSVSENVFPQNSEKQLRFMENLVHLVKPSGILVYTVCSTEPEENQDVVDLFLDKHPEFTIDNASSMLPGAADALVAENGCFLTLPHLNGMDGFFAVRLKRIT